MGEGQERKARLLVVLLLSGELRPREAICAEGPQHGGEEHRCDNSSAQAELDEGLLLLPRFCSQRL